MSRHSGMSTTFTARGFRRYEIEIFHDELNKYQLIRGDDASVVEQKARSKMAEWDEIWTKRSEREQWGQDIGDKKKTADERTREAQQNLSFLGLVLTQALTIDPSVDWDALKNHSDYSLARPNKSTLKKPDSPKIPSEPQRSWPVFTAKLSILDRVSKSRREQREQEAEAAFNQAHKKWQLEKAELLRIYQDRIHQYEINLQKQDLQYARAVESWEKERSEYIRKREEANVAIDERKAVYDHGRPEAILDYCDMLLSKSAYPDYFPQSYQLDYNPENKLLLVDYQLPPIGSIPTLREVRYVQSRDQFVESHTSGPQLNKLYDDLLYQIALRTVYELFKADQAGAISSVVFNGYVKSVAPATGQEINPCVLSLQTNKNEFLQINLANVDPKACFKQLKGVGSSRLHSMTPIAPILKIERGDKRFIASYAVANGLQEAVNLAMMDWQDFEHLVRELFEKEYGGPNNEVKVTRASRDGGVDAVAFDSDPIRGGKTVTQAKRYTNTVGVSAVRDLYGTVLNEGAMKGILVTTSDYGPDAYEFARGKPLTLLNGGNLLHLLEKHGHKARIDLAEAKREMPRESS